VIFINFKNQNGKEELVSIQEQKTLVCSNGNIVPRFREGKGGKEI